MIRRTVLPFCSFVLAVAAIFSAIVLLGQVNVDTITGPPGQADMTGVDFAGATAETGSLLYTPGLFLRPGQPPPANDGQDAAFGTYSISIAIPNGEYILGFNSIEYATRVYINGELVDEVGVVADTKEAYTPARAYRHYVVRPQNGSLDLVFHYANFYEGYGKPPTLYIGLPNQMINRQVHADFTRFTLMAVYLAAFLLYFGIYLFRRSGAETMFFAVTCLYMAARESFVGEQFLSAFLEDISWDILFIVQYLSIGILVILLFSFTISLFPFVLPKRGARVFYVACFSFLVVAAFTQTYMPRLSLYVYLGIGAFVMVYILVQITRRLKTLPPDKILSAGGVWLLYMAFFNDMFHLLHLPVGPIGRQAMLQSVMIVFIFIQMIALFLQFMRTERELGEVRARQAALSSQNETLQLVDRQRVQFLSNVSHELKTPLTVVSNYAQLSRQHEERKDPPDGYVVNKMLLVASEAERMALMVDQILDIARIEEGRMRYEFEPVDIGALVQSTIGVYYPVLNKNRNTLRIDVAPALPHVHADAGRISQVLVNPIGNAVKFTSRGTITVSAQAQGQAVAITVRDTGVGMDEDHRLHLFERYYTREGVDNQGPGTGLGLYISREIVLDHGGELAVESTPGQGTSVTFTLPTKRKGEEKSHDAAEHTVG